MLGILSQDSYKYSHFLQLPEGITRSVSYIEARGYDKNGVIPEGEEIVFCGINGFIKNVMSKPITYEQVNKMEMLSKAHGIPFNKQGFLNIIKEYNGYLPVIIEALPEGTLVKPGVPMVQVYNIDDKYAWITSFIETQLLQAIWYPTTVATLSRSIKKLIKEYLEKTSDNIDGLPFKLHDFGQRGASSMESAAIGGAAHLINFMGTDTMAAIEYLYDLYGDVYGFSIPASEHQISGIYNALYEGIISK